MSLPQPQTLSAEAIAPVLAQLAMSLVDTSRCAFCQEAVIGAAMVGSRERAVFVVVAVCATCQPVNVDAAEGLLRRLTGRLS